MAFRFGEKLAPLCEQGVLVAGSGNIVHNLRTMRCEPAGGYDRAIDFRNTVNRALTVRDNDTLVHYERLVEAAALSVSSPRNTTCRCSTPPRCANRMTIWKYSMTNSLSAQSA